MSFNFDCKTTCDKKLCQQCGVTELCPQCEINPLICDGFGKPMLCDNCLAQPCEMCGNKDFLSTDELTGKQICIHCQKSIFKKQCTMCDKYLDFYGYTMYCNETGAYCCKECFEIHVAKPCYRCGKPGEEQDGYWECYDCCHTWWCTECDENKSVYFDGPDSGYNAGFCLGCLFKQELSNVNCECGLEGKFYNKCEHKWLCVNCVLVV
jgi:hypothetical protein